MEIAKIAGLALLGVFTALLLKQGKGEYSFIIGLAMAFLVCGYVINHLIEVIKSLEGIWNRVSSSTEILQLLLRMIGISYISDLTAGICKESGYQVLSNQVSLAGKIGVLLTGFPVFMDLVGFVLKLGGDS